MWRCNTAKNIWLTVSKKSEACDVWIGYCSLLKSQKAAKCQECRSGCCHFQTKFDLKNTRMYVCIITWNRTRCLLSHVNDVARHQEIWLLIFVACELQDVQYTVEKVLFWVYFVDQSQNGSARFNACSQIASFEILVQSRDSACTANRDILLCAAV
jgi:hypothetical protein